MSATTLTIGWVRDLPKMAVATQVKALIAYGCAERDIVIDGRKSPTGRMDNWSWLGRKLRTGDTLAVYKLRAVYSPRAKRTPRKALYAIIHALEDRGIRWVEVATGRRSWAPRERDMAISDTLDEIARSRTGGDAGRPRRVWNEAERKIVERYWFDLRIPTNAEAFEKIKDAAKAAGLIELAGLKHSTSIGNRNAFGPSGRGRK